MSTRDPAAHGRASRAGRTSRASRAGRSSVPPEDRLLSLLVALRTAPHPMSGQEISLHVHGYPGMWDDSAKRLLERDKLLARQLGLPLETVGEGPGSRYRLGDLAGPAVTGPVVGSGDGVDAGPAVPRDAAASEESQPGGPPGAGAGEGPYAPAWPQPEAQAAGHQGRGLTVPVRLTPAQLGVLTLAAEAWSEGELAATAHSALAKLRGMSGPWTAGADPSSPDPLVDGPDPAREDARAGDADRPFQAGKPGAVDRVALPGGAHSAGLRGPSSEAGAADPAGREGPAATAEGHASRQPVGIMLRLPAGEVPSTLLEAVATRRRVTFDYECASSTASGRPRSRLVEPYRLRVAEPGWYLEGRDVDRGERRTYRLSRIRSAVRLASPPAAFTPDAVPSARLTAHLAIASGHGTALRRRGLAGTVDDTVTGGALAPDQVGVLPAGWDRVAVAYEPAEAAGLAGEIAAQCEWVKVLAPADLAGLVREHLDGVRAVVERLAGHGQAGPGDGAGREGTRVGEEARGTRAQVCRKQAPAPGDAAGTAGAARRRPAREVRRRPTVRETVSRRLALLAWVERHPGASLSEAGRWFDVSEETIYRDVLAWWGAGRADAADPDRLDFDQAALDDGELYLTRALQMSEPVGLTAQEGTCLRLALEVLRHGLGEDPELAQLIEQADSALASPEGGSRAGTVGAGDGLRGPDRPGDGRAGGAGEPGDAGDAGLPGGAGVLATIRAAMEAGESVHLVYVDALDQRTERDVDPLELVMGDASHIGGGSGMVPVLTAWCHLAAAQRSFRLDRVIQAARTGQISHPPARAYRRRRAQTASFRARLHVSQEGAWLAEEPFAQDARRLEDGTWEVDVASWNRPWLVHLVLRAGRVLLGVSPQTLAEEAAALARQA